MRAGEFIVESRTKEFGGIEFKITPLDAAQSEHEGFIVTALDPNWGRELGYVVFADMGNDELDPRDLSVDERYQGQGIAKTMYDYVKSLGYTIHRSSDQTPAGKGFWDKHRGEEANIWEAKVPSVRDQILADVRKHGGNPNEYFVRFTGVDRLGYSAKQPFARSPDVDDPNFSPDYIGTGKGRRALWFYPLSYYLRSKDAYATENPYVFLVRIRPDAWLQPVNDKTSQIAPAPEGKKRVGLLRQSSLMPAAIFFEPAFDVVGRYYDYAGQHRRHGQVKGAPAPSFFDRVRGHNLNEVNIDTDYNPDELTVKQKFIDYFVDKGYDMIGEGRDQIAFLSPRNTVVKVLGLGDTARQQAVEHYVEFFERNQRNPFYPKIYNSQRFTFDGDSYFLYETEYLNYVSNEDDTLDWLERYLNHLGTDPVAAQEWIEKNGVPNDIGEDQLHGLTQSTEDIIEYLAGPNGYMMDLSNIENIRRRGDGQLVIVDPISI